VSNFAPLGEHYPLLETIQYPKDLKRFALNELPNLCDELRSFIIETVLTHGGHFAANLGVVELTVALHYVLDTPNDRLVWDVGHQAYGHKILTGRRHLFHTNRKLGGLSGFPKIDESEYDAFGTGHSSTAISAILGMAMAAKLKGLKNRQHVAVVGDGALTAGQAFEGLNNFSVSGTNALLILNDNNIGIDVNTGAINRHFNSIDTQNNLFTNLGISYEGPIDGHDVIELVKKLETLKASNFPKVLHIKTIKGKGFPAAEKEQTKWHSTAKYVKIEDPEKAKLPVKSRYQDVFGQTLMELAEKNSMILGVTPAMPTGSGMIKAMERFPNRFFDVGIAEQHAVTFAAGMAKEGFTVFCSLYSTFMQRAYDQVIHDVCLQNLPVIFCIDRAGNVGDDGSTHHGMFDIAMLRPLPNITLVSPASGEQLREMMHYYAEHAEGPVGIRYPKGAIDGNEIDWRVAPHGLDAPKTELIHAGKGTAIVSVGTMLKNCEKALPLLEIRGIKPAIYDVKIIKPADLSELEAILKNYNFVISVEDGSAIGGMGETLLNLAAKIGSVCKIQCLGFADEVIEQGTVDELFKKYGLDANGIAMAILELHEK